MRLSRATVGTADAGLRWSLQFGRQWPRAADHRR